jgi:hypothetical protein
MAIDKKERLSIVKEVAESFEKTCLEKLGERLESLYVVGSYALGNISLDRPDLNFLLILKGYATPNDYLMVGEICKGIVGSFRNKCRILVEFRPFRYIYPKTRGGYDVTLNPIIQSVQEIRERGVIFTKWFTEGMKNANRLIRGEDFLATVNVGEITRQDILQGAMFDLPFFTIPLTRAPTQYDENEVDLLFNEALTNAKNISYLGVEVAMSEEELRRKDYLKHIEGKQTMVHFYEQRYGEEAGRLITKILDARENYLEYKDDKTRAEEMFGVALEIAGLVQRKVFTGNI